MSEEKTMRIGQAARQLNIGLDRAVEFLAGHGHKVERNPNAKISLSQFQILEAEFASSALEKKEASELHIGGKHGNQIIEAETALKEKRKHEEDDADIITKPAIDYHLRQTRAVYQEPKKEVAPEPVKETPKVEVPPPPPEPTPEPEIIPGPEPQPEVLPDLIEAKAEKLSGLKVLDKIDLGAKKPKAPTGKAKKETEEVPPKVNVSEQVKTEEKPKPTEEISPQIAATVEAPIQEKAIEPVAEKEAETVVPEEEAPESIDLIEAKADQLQGLKILGKINLTQFEKPVKPAVSKEDQANEFKKKRARLKPSPVAVGTADGNLVHKENVGWKPPGERKEGENKPGTQSPQRDNRGGKPNERKDKAPISQKQISGQIKATMAKMSGKGGKKKFKDRRGGSGYDGDDHEMEEDKKLNVTEFVSVADLASLMNVSVNDVIATCMKNGMFVSINQRLDAEAITFIADEFGFDADFSGVEEEAVIEIEADEEEDLLPRAPIVTIMGHVDHGKTSLLDYIRKTKVVASEAGGITQHIGAYDVMTESGKKITFLDTPGHEAFTAMRARGAKVTDVAIIVVAADDNVMPQTKEAINHAQIAGVPIVIAINKIDKPAANPEKIREELAQLNILVEEWGGKYQSQEISAKKGIGISELLEKVLLEAELLELKANPDKRANGTVIEASLDKGRGYVSTLLVQAGTLKVGDIMLVGTMYGRVKAMMDDTGAKILKAGPSVPVQVLGLNGAPTSGEKFNIMENEREAKEIANSREQIQREQSLRTKKHITIDEIGRRIALGNFKELNLILKGDVDGSVEALSDALMKLSTEEIIVKIIHKAVGQISETDVMLASASDAIIIGFQVRPSAQARKIAEQEQIEIKLYSIIYDAINEVKDAMEGLLAPKIEEIIVGNAEIRNVFKISKVGNVAGCYVTEGYIKRQNPIRLVRDGIVMYTGELSALKRFKDDVNEVKFGYECGMSIKNYNDLQEGDTLESFEQREVKRTL